MKQYQKDRDVSSHYLAPTTLPVLPSFSDGDPKANTFVYRWYNNKGKYIGWTDADVTKKFLYGKLYYKTKGAYTVKTKRLYDSSTTGRKVLIYLKGTNELAAAAVYSAIAEADLVDLSDRAMLCRHTIDRLKDCRLDNYNYYNYPNPYKIIPEDFRNKLQQEMQAFIESKRQELIDYVTKEKDAHEEFITSSQEVGILADF